IYLEKITDELAMSEDYDGYIKMAKEKLDKQYDEAYKLGEALSVHRKKLALKLEKELTQALKLLDLDKAQFKIEFEPLKPKMSLGEDGLDSVEDRKSTRLNSSHVKISYAVFCLKTKNDNRIKMNSS